MKTDEKVTRILIVDRDRPGVESIDHAASIIRRGGLVAFPTETVYGLGANATDAKAVAAIFEAKGRPSYNPLIVHVSDLEMAWSCVSNPPAVFERLARRFWPGPLTLVGPRSDWIAANVSAGLATVAVRMPANAVAHALVEHSGVPIAAPSANRSNRVSPTTAEHVLKDLNGLIDAVLDGGPCALGVESTVLDLTREIPAILRPGPIAAQAIEAELGFAIQDFEPLDSSREHAFKKNDHNDQLIDGGRGDIATKSPGTSAVHYAPRTRATRIEAERIGSIEWTGRVGLLVLGEHAIDLLLERTDRREVPAVRIDLRDPVAAAEAFYRTLHEFDELALDEIVIVLPPDRREWLAVRDRATRAARPYQIKT
jgi:L-threonylcarbamoyladenylate synthase